jgi:peptide/nickel transport system substrate-binding protein
VVCVAVLLGVLAASCGDDADEGGSQAGGGGDDPGASTTQAPEGEPTPGGTLTIGTYSEPRGLDPIVATGYGVTGGIELTALYDTLVAYNTETGGYDMRTAESLEPNADFTEWTLKVRDGITFRDGTPYDAAAVKFNIERHQSAANVTTSRAMTASITGVEIVDPLTVRITLASSWAGFPFVLADRVGMLVSPTAVETLGDQLVLNPVGAGAGPFEIVSFTPKEAIVMKRNDSYWGGDVYLDELRFVNIVGGDLTFESLDADTVNMAFLREPKAVERAQEAGYPGFSNVQQAGQVLLMNNGVTVTCKDGQPEICAGQPDGTSVATTTATASKTVRQAIAAAIDPTFVNDRVNDGVGIATSALFDSTFPWDPGVPGPEYDLDRAKELVAQAKSEGWDGKVRFICDNAPSAQQRAQAITTALQAAGMEPILTNDADVSATITAVITKKDFDLACWGLSVPGDDGAIFQVGYFFDSKGTSNRTGYKNADMDAALQELRAASTDAARTAAFAKVAELYTEDVPMLSLQAIEEYIAWHDDVHGVVPNQGTQVFLDKAWIAS